MVAVVLVEGFPDKNILEKRIKKIVTNAMIMIMIIIIIIIIYCKNSTTTINNKNNDKNRKIDFKQSGYNVNEREKFFKAF